METASAEQSGIPAVVDEGVAPAPPTPDPPAEVAAPAAPSPFPALSPADGTPLASVAATDPALIPEMVARARKAQAEWAKTPVASRAATLARLKRKVLERAEEIAELLHRECGKPIEEGALAEVLPNAD